MSMLLLLVLAGCGSTAPCGPWSFLGTDQLLVHHSPDGTTVSERWAERGTWQGEDAWRMSIDSRQEAPEYRSEVAWTAWYRCDAEGIWNLHQAWEVQGASDGEPFAGAGATWYDDPPRTRPLDPAPGEAWEVEATWRTEVDGQMSSPQTDAWTVEVLEQGPVDVPAGGFEGLQLQSDRGSHLATWWLGPSLGLIASSDLELVEVR